MAFSIGFLSSVNVSDLPFQAQVVSCTNDADCPETGACGACQISNNTCSRICTAWHCIGGSCTSTPTSEACNPGDCDTCDPNLCDTTPVCGACIDLGNLSCGKECYAMRCSGDECVNTLVRVEPCAPPACAFVSCNNDADCGDPNQCCINNTCANCGAVTPCTDDSDCLGQNECCRNNICTINCGDVCGDGQITGTEQCEQDSDCLAGQTCTDCQCVDLNTCTDVCMTTSACQQGGGICTGEICPNNACCCFIPSGDVCGDGQITGNEDCEQDSDCLGNET